MEELSTKIRKNDRKGGRVEKIHRSVNRHTHLHPSHNIIFQKKKRPYIKNNFSHPFLHTLTPHTQTLIKKKIQNTKQK